MGPGLEAFSLSGKVAVVTGAAMGIGRAMAQALAAAGATIVCLDIHRCKGEAAARTLRDQGFEALALECDVADESAVGRAIDSAHRRLGRIDVLVHAAAFREPAGTVVEYALADWDNVFRVAVTGAFLLCKHAIPIMSATGGGSIILVASQLARVGAPRRAAYCSAKGAVIQLARVLAVDHAAQNIRVNSLSPGAVETDRLVHHFGSLEEARSRAAGKHVLGRLGLPHELGPAAVFLASDASSFMTGADLLIDGGYTAI